MITIDIKKDLKNDLDGQAARPGNKGARRIIALMLAAVMVMSMIFIASCGSSKEKDAGKEEKKVEYVASSPLGIAESYVGKDVKGLIAEVGTLKGEPEISPTNDGGGYEGVYVFDGFTAYTYAKSPDAKSIVTEIVPDKSSTVYKESIKEKSEGTK